MTERTRPGRTVPTPINAWAWRVREGLTQLSPRDLPAAHAHLYAAQVPGDCPASDYSVRVIPHYPEVLVPLEESRILWER